jgi:hypothetical protein
MSVRLRIVAAAVAVSWACAPPPGESDAVKRLEAKVATLESRISQIQPSLDAARQREDALKAELAKLNDLLQQYSQPEPRSEAADEDAAATERVVEAPAPPADRLTRQPWVTPAPFEFKHLTVRVQSFDVLRTNRIQLGVEFANTHEKGGLAVAHRAVNSDGIADFWKFFPQPIGRIVDDNGNEYGLTQDCVLGCAREKSDWLILAAGDRIAKSLVFDGRARSEPADVYSASFDVRVVTGNTGPNNVTPVSIIFRDLRAK